MKRSRLMILTLMLSVLWSCSVEDKIDSDLQSLVSDSDMTASYIQFTMRDQGAEKSLKAKNAIKATIDRTKRDWDNEYQYINLVEWYSKVSLYHAMVYLQNKTERVKAYRELIAVLEQTVSPDILRYDHPSYYYFKSFALMNIADDGTAIEQLQSLTDLNNIFFKTYDQYQLLSYEGGGLDRIQARMRSADYFSGVPGGTYYPESALFLANRALNSEAYPSQAYGMIYCENVRIKGDIERLIGSGLKKHTLMRAQTIHDFSSFILDDIISEDIRAETKLCLSKIKEGIAKDGFIVEELFQGKPDSYFSYAASVSFIPTGSRDDRLTLEAYCPSDDLFTAPTVLAKSGFFDYNKVLSGKTASISFDLDSDGLACKDFFLFLIVLSQPLLHQSFLLHSQTME